ncbi:ATP-binding protein [Streptomyces sp. NPDC090106]|uniref:ATP-binding protein n=1 Tax=Streptomyces sp. NPDC090106 TaxID=3365946 RepID=UPI0037F6769E
MNQKSAPQVVTPTHYFTVLLSADRSGAHRAREHVRRQLLDWGAPCDHDAVAHVVAELAANAVLHGRVPGRDFRLRLKLYGDGGPLRVEVTDARGDRLPRAGDGAAGDAESGRGLLIVEAYAERWGVEEAPAGGKTVWAEVATDREEL